MEPLSSTSPRFARRFRIPLIPPTLSCLPSVTSSLPISCCGCLTSSDGGLLLSTSSMVVILSRLFQMCLFDLATFETVTRNPADVFRDRGSPKLYRSTQSIKMINNKHTAQDLSKTTYQCDPYFHHDSYQWRIPGAQAEKKS